MENSKRHILVIDDEDSIRDMLEKKLFSCGYMVSTAANGLHALQKVRGGEIFDLIICDLKMKGMSGDQFFQELQSLNIHVPFLMITGYPEKDKLVRVAKGGINHILIKPVKHGDLMDKIEDLLEFESEEGELKIA